MSGMPGYRIHVLTLDPGQCFRFRVDGPVYRVALGSRGEYRAEPAGGVGPSAELAIEGCFVLPAADPLKPSEADDDAVS